MNIRPKQICEYFNSHLGCRFGNNCRFLHSKPKIYHTSRSPKRKHGTPVNQRSEREFEEREVSLALENLEIHDEAVNTVQSNPTGNLGVNTKVCFSYQKYKKCRFGRNCRFVHSEPQQENLNTDFDSSNYDNKNNDDDSKNRSVQPIAPTRKPNSKHERPKRICDYFKAGNCHKGDRCRFYHPLEHNVDPLDSLLDVDKKLSKPKGNIAIDGDQGRAPSGGRDIKQKRKGPNEQSKGDINRFNENRRRFQNRPLRPVIKPQVIKTELKRTGETDEAICALKRTEIEQMKKRLGSKLQVLKEGDRDGSYRFPFSSSDPDWPYDVKVFEFEITFPHDFPYKMFTVNLPVDQDLPETVRRYIEVSVTEWLETKQAQLEDSGLLQMVFRPFLRWLDKNLEAIVTGGLKQLQRELAARAAGLEFIPAKQLQQHMQNERSDGSEEDEEEESDESSEENQREGVVYRKQDDDEEVYTGPTRESDSSEDEDGDENVLNPVLGNSSQSSKNERRGTEIRCRNLQLLENASTMTYTEISVTIQCCRCKSKSEIVTPVGRPNLISCNKCHNTQIVNFRSAIMHQFSSTLGYLDLEGCIPFDLILQDSTYKVGCFSCNKEMKAKNISPGQISDVWCTTCHAKMRLAIDSVRFNQLEPSGLDTDLDKLHHLPALKVKKIIKDPAIQLGKPLPEFGICKHYKKSFRWFRFPCCGKTYPCDVCHEEQEGDHEMLLANRMICGYCCREQPFSLDKPCVACLHALTKARSSHWEGGLGCRDKIKMSKSDSQKYQGQHKTTSRKVQEKMKPGGKKNTKLRHNSK